MERPTNYENKSQTTQITGKIYKYEKCNECNKRRKTSDKSHHICHVCFKIKTLYQPNPSGNKVIDDFIRHTQTNYAKKEGKMEFVSFDRFMNVEFIAEGGFSKVYKAIWIDGPVDMNKNIREPNYTVVLKKLNNSKDITSKELNELKMFYEFSIGWKTHRDRNKKSIDTPSLYKYYNYGYYNYVSKYFGITQHPSTQEIMIIMPYYKSGDLRHYITKGFYDNTWEEKLRNLKKIIIGLINMHSANIIHRDLHSGNIFFGNEGTVVIGDLGVSKFATEPTNDSNNESYGIIPYMAPEIFQRNEYTKASDIYSFGMIMWEFMTGRRPFWNERHDIDLIIKICDGERPPIVTNTPEGYIELMKECWHHDPNKRPTTIDAYSKIKDIHDREWENDQNFNPTKIIKSSDIGPITINSSDANHKSGLLSRAINSAMSLRSSRSQSIIDPFHNYQKSNIFFNDKRNFEDNRIGNSFISEKNIKRIKLIGNENSDGITEELKLDIASIPYDNEYITKETNFDI